MDAREVLRAAKAADESPFRFFPKLVEAAPTLLYVTPLVGPLPDPLDNPDDLLEHMRVLKLSDPKTGKVMIPLFTDAEATTPVIRQYYPQGTTMMKSPARETLQMAIRMDPDYVGVNPGDPAELMMEKRLAVLLHREYALPELLARGGAWVPMKDGTLMIGQFEEQMRALPIYLSESDARERHPIPGGDVQFHPWSRIRSRLAEAETEELFLQQGFPEEVRLHRPEIARASGSGPDPLDELETALSLAGGFANAAHIRMALRNLDRIWVVLDQDGDPVGAATRGTRRALNIFTSRKAACRWIYARPTPPDSLRPALIPAQPLFAMMASQQPLLLINQGSDNEWMDLGDTLPTLVGLPHAAAQAPVPQNLRGGASIAPGSARRAWHPLTRLWDGPSWSRRGAVLGRIFFWIGLIGLVLEGIDRLTYPSSTHSTIFEALFMLGLGLFCHGFAAARARPQISLARDRWRLISVGWQCVVGLILTIVGWPHTHV